MNIRFNTAVKMLALVAAMGAGSSALAQSAGTWIGIVGVNKISPKVDSGFVSAPALPGSQADVGNSTKPVFNIAYMYTDSVSFELDLGVPYKHTLYGAGALQGTGKLGTSEVLPPTLLVQYRFLPPTSKFRPFVGVGVTYAYFRKEKGSAQLTSILNTGGGPSSFELDNKFAASGQVGASYAVSERWSVGFAVIKTALKTTAHYSTGQTQGITLNPLAISVGVGYRF